jgi:hypothetical protein
MNDGDRDDGQRPLWEELLLLTIPILLAEGIDMLREHLQRKGKKKRKREREEVPVPRA